MNIDNFVGNLVHSFKVLFKNYKVLWIGVATELIFILLYRIISQIIFYGMETNLEQLGGDMIKQSNSITDNFFVNAIHTSYFTKIVILGLILSVLVYLLYSLFQGFIWRFYMDLTGEKGKYVVYIKRFFLVNLLWFPLYALYSLMNFFFFYLDTVGKRLDPNGSFFLSTAIYIFLFFILYFAFISYTLISKYKAVQSIKESFRIGIKKVHWLLITYFVLYLIYRIFNYLGGISAGLNEYLLLLIGIAIVTPMIGWSRIFLKITMDDLS